METGLRNKTALVTAASKGIGKGCAAALIKEGCRVIISSSNAKNLEYALKEFSAIPGAQVHAVKCDLNLKSDIQNLYEQVKSLYGGIDILVNNCGGPHPGFFEELGEDKWDYAYDQVLMGPVRLIKLFLPSMKQKKWGRIINITSLSVFQPIDNLILSNTFRTGLTALAKTLSNRFAANNITVNNVAPGYVLTERIKELAENKAKVTGETAEQIFEKMKSEIPMQRIGQPEDIANAVVFLASEGASYITGNTIHVDGGRVVSYF